jgi:hypothetical protein
MLEAPWKSRLRLTRIAFSGGVMHRGQICARGMRLRGGLRFRDKGFHLAHATSVHADSAGIRTVTFVPRPGSLSMCSSLPYSYFKRLLMFNRPTP